MEVEYKVFSGIKPDGSIITNAIRPSELEEDAPSDFFRPDVKDIKLSGTIFISGDTVLIEYYFTIDG